MSSREYFIQIYNFNEESGDDLLDFVNCDVVRYFITKQQIGDIGSFEEKKKIKLVFREEILEKIVLQTPFFSEEKDLEYLRGVLSVFCKGKNMIFVPETIQVEENGHKNEGINDFFLNFDFFCYKLFVSKEISSHALETAKRFLFGLQRNYYL